MGEKNLNTNLASEFYVMSMLHRLGKNALLTLGNKKSVDIVIEEGRNTLTIDVKGLQGKSSFPVDNCIKKQKNHFILFVAYNNKISDILYSPDVYILPSTELDKIVYTSPKDKLKRVKLGSLKDLKDKYHNRWDLLNE